MKKYELEALFKSFLLFFTSLGLFLGLIFWQSYQQKITTFDQDLFAQMRVCSFDLNCPHFDIDFIPKDEKKPLFLYHDDDGGVSACFDIATSNAYLLEFSYPQDRYSQDKREIRTKELLRFLLFLLGIMLLSLVFSFYALYPMKKALLMIEEFIKDILHDFNTPISSIILNASMLQKDSKNSDKLMRIDQSAQRILSLQENLKSYLFQIEKKKECFNLKEMIEQRSAVIAKLYPDIHWEISVDSIMIETYKPAFERIIVNLLSNAAKYNKKEGKIFISIERGVWLKIEDTGIGIKNTESIFERFYTESSRGTGIGLHIVRKLCDELKIGIKVTSSVKKGSIFMLNISSITKR